MKLYRTRYYYDVWEKGLFYKKSSINGIPTGNEYYNAIELFVSNGQYILFGNRNLDYIFQLQYYN